MTIEEMKNQAEACAENELDTFMFYLEEYGKEIDMEIIAKIFINAYRDAFFTMAKELKESWKEEGII